LADSSTFTSCFQPALLQDRRFEFAGQISGLGPVRLYLDPVRISTGTIAADPTSLPHSCAEIVPGQTVFPARNQLAFYLRLDIPDLGLALTNVNPLSVSTTIGTWPPPVGATYALAQQVNFADRGPDGLPVGPTRATLKLSSVSEFSPPGGYTLNVSQGVTSPAQIDVTGSITSSADTAIAVTWHYYTRGTLAALGATPSGTAAFGPQAGIATLPSSGSVATVPLTLTLSRPGSEFVTFVASTVLHGQGRSDKGELRVVLPDNGLVVSSVSPATIPADGQVHQVTLTGQGFQLPTVAFTGAGVTVQQVVVVNSQLLHVNVVVALNALPTTRDIIVTSTGRSFYFAQGPTVTWPAPGITSVSPTHISAGQAFNLTVTGSRFMPSPSVTLGTQLQVTGVQRISSTMLTVTGQAPLSASGPVDVVLLTASGAACLSAGLVVDPLMVAVPSMSRVGLTLLGMVLVASALAFKRRRRPRLPPS